MMHLPSRVVWSEGMFLRPQHFQQHDRWVEGLLRSGLHRLHGYPWGFASLNLAAENARLRVLSASGILPDGTPFDVADGGGDLVPLELAPNTAAGTVYLCLATVNGPAEIDAQGRPDTGMRYRGELHKVGDAVADQADNQAELELARPKLMLRLTETASRALEGDTTRLAVARTLAVKPAGEIVLDEDFVPPCLQIGAHRAFGSLLDEVEQKLRTAAQSRIDWVVRPKEGGAGNYEDLLVIELVNRAEPFVRHLRQQLIAHPEWLYGYLVGLAGEMSTYGRADRRPPSFRAYEHGDLGPVLKELREVLRALLFELTQPVRPVVEIKLLEQRANPAVRRAVVPDEQLFRARFILIVRADMPQERIAALVPRQVTVSPVEDFPPLWNTRLPGIKLAPLATAPRQLPYREGVYFEFDQGSREWNRLSSSNGLAIGVAGDFPNLALECWAIRE